MILSYQKERPHSSRALLQEEKWLPITLQSPGTHSSWWSACMSTGDAEDRMGRRGEKQGDVRQNRGNAGSSGQGSKTGAVGETDVGV